MRQVHSMCAGDFLISPGKSEVGRISYCRRRVLCMFLLQGLAGAGDHLANDAKRPG